MTTLHKPTNIENISCGLVTACRVCVGALFVTFAFAYIFFLCPVRSFGEQARRKRLKPYGISHAIRKESLEQTACRSTISWKSALEEYGHLSHFLCCPAHLPHWSRSFVSATNKRARIERRKTKCRGLLFYCLVVVADDLSMVIRG